MRRISINEVLRDIEAAGLKSENLFDTHCHLSDRRYSPEELRELLETGMKVLTLTTRPEDLLLLEEWGLLEFPNLYLGVGIHPHEAKDFSPEEAQEFILRAYESYGEKVRAVGEIGLDYYYEFSPREHQKLIFYAQLEVAKRLNLPVSVHSRNAEKEVLKALGDMRVSKGGLHSYTGPIELAQEGVDMGFYVSFNGILTFPRSGEVRALLKVIPEDRILLETDSPYLAPQPHRGKLNLPVAVFYVLKTTSEILGVSIHELSERIFSNSLGFVGAEEESSEKVQDLEGKLKG